MEPVAEFIEDAFIICFAWRYWIIGSALLGPVIVLLVRGLGSRRPQVEGRERASSVAQYAVRS
jgi:hypothetical protein